MGLSGGSSSGLAALCCTMVFASLQMYKTQLASTRVMTLIAGYAASWLFVFMLIAINSLEQVVFGSGFQAQLMPEVVLCLVVACGAAAMVHRVSCTVCLLCSLAALYFINRISTEYQNKTNPLNQYSKKKK